MPRSSPKAVAMKQDVLDQVLLHFTEQRDDEWIRTGEGIEEDAAWDGEGPFVCMGCGNANERWFVCATSARCSRREVEPAQIRGVLNAAVVRRFGKPKVAAFLDQALERTVRSRLAVQRSCVVAGAPSERALELLDEDDERSEGTWSSDDSAEEGDPKTTHDLVRTLDEFRRERNAKFVARRDVLLVLLPRDELRRIAAYSDAKTFGSCSAACAALRAASNDEAQGVFRRLALARFPVLHLQTPHMCPDVDFKALYRARLEPEKPPDDDVPCLDDDFLFTVEVYDEANTHYFSCLALERREPDESCVLYTDPLPEATFDFLHKQPDPRTYDTHVPRIRVCCLKKGTTAHLCLYDMCVEDMAIDGGPYFTEDAVQHHFTEFVHHLREVQMPIAEVRPSLCIHTGCLFVHFLAWLESWDVSEPATRADVRNLLTNYVSFTTT